MEKKLAADSNGITKDLFENVTERIFVELDKLSSKVELMTANSNSKFELINSELKRLELQFATKNIDGLTETTKKLQDKVEALEHFKTRVLTTMLILNGAAFVIWSALQVWLRVKNPGGGN